VDELVSTFAFKFSLRRYDEGATVGGVVGQKMLRYHLFGPPLTGVERMEQACDPGGVRCSEHFADQLRRSAPPGRGLHSSIQLNLSRF